MTRRTRVAVFLLAAAVLCSLLVSALAGLPAVGHFHGAYAVLLEHVAVAQRKATDIVNSITYDYRGFDTMGEEFILFAAAVGLVVLLRAQRGEHEDRETAAEPDGVDRAPREASVALRAGGLSLIGPVLVLGVYVATHGQLTPGGGFQGGVILAAALFLVYLIGGYLVTARVRPLSAVELAEALGAAGYVAIGAGGLIAGSEFLFNFLPLGTKGSLLSGGTIAGLSAVVGLEVAGAFSLILSEFVEQRRLSGGGG